MHGIGGKTIEEVQRNLSVPEVMKWLAYRQKRGTLNWGMRIERGAALLASIYVNAHRSKGTPRQSIHAFMPNAGDVEISLDEAMNTWR